MKPQQDKWINDILGSIDGLQRAEPSLFLYAKIRNRLTSIYVPARTVWVVVASFALLLLLNWRIIGQRPEPVTTYTNELSTVVSDMQLYPATNQPYDLWSGQNY